jgi:selenocysteine lyase/cysteine desulfurase
MEAQPATWAGQPTTDSMHYLNQAAGGLMPDSVLHAVSHYMQREQALGAYIASQQVQPQLQQLYARLAELLHCQPADIALTTGNTHGWCAVVGALPLEAGDRVLVTPGNGAATTPCCASCRRAPAAWSSNALHARRCTGHGGAAGLGGCARQAGRPHLGSRQRLHGV